MKRFLFIPLIPLFAAALAGCAPSGDSLTFDDPWMRPSPMQAGNGAGYVVINNPTDQDDALIAVKSDISDAIELHRTMEMEDQPDVMQMQPVQQIDIPAGSSAELKPGGYHIMLIGLNTELEPGSSVTLTLVFEQAGEIDVVFEVR